MKYTGFGRNLNNIEVRAVEKMENRYPFLGDVKRGMVLDLIRYAKRLKTNRDKGGKDEI